MPSLPYLLIDGYVCRADDKPIARRKICLDRSAYCDNLASLFGRLGCFAYFFVGPDEGDKRAIQVIVQGGKASQDCEISPYLHFLEGSFT